MHIHNLHRLQETEGLKAANKLSIRHVEFELQKMKTKLCLQVMSNSVSNALNLCRELGIPDFNGSAATEEFLYLMNQLFDIMNSKSHGVGFFNTPATKAKLPDIYAFFAMMKFYLMTLEVNEGGKWILLINSRKRTAARGLVITINSLEKLMKDLLDQNPTLK